jgi:hypothetical protein
MIPLKVIVFCKVMVFPKGHNTFRIGVNFFGRLLQNWVSEGPVLITSGLIGSSYIALDGPFKIL